MLWHGAQAGAFDLKAAVLEVMTAFRRAGKLAGAGFLTWTHRLIGSLPRNGNEVLKQPGVLGPRGNSDLNRHRLRGKDTTVEQNMEQ